MSFQGKFQRTDGRISRAGQLAAEQLGRLLRIGCQHLGEQVVFGSDGVTLAGANFNGSEIDALCLAVWDLSRVYPAQGRGEHCTSSDAAGFPIAALMPNADGVAAAMTTPDGDLGHAIRQPALRTGFANLRRR